MAYAFGDPVVHRYGGGTGVFSIAGTPTRAVEIAAMVTPNASGSTPFNNFYDSLGATTNIMALVFVDGKPYYVSLVVSPLPCTCSDLGVVTGDSTLDGITVTAEVGGTFKLGDIYVWTATDAALANSRSLSSLVNEVRQRSDQVNSLYVTDDEIANYLRAEHFSLYNLLVQKFEGNYYMATPYTFATDGTNDRFSLPTDFFKLLGVDLKLGSTDDSYVSLHPFNFGERNQFAVPNTQNFRGSTNLRYRLVGNQLMFAPKPAAGQTVRVWYAPRLTPMQLASDTMDGISGFEEMVILGAVIRVKAKQEEDISYEAAERKRLEQQIEDAAANRDAGAPATVTDSRSSDLVWPYGRDGAGGVR